MSEKKYSTGLVLSGGGTRGFAHLGVIQALNEAGILPHETLFIDDMEVNTEAAKSIGMQVLNIEPGSLMEVLPNYLKELKR